MSKFAFVVSEDLGLNDYENIVVCRTKDMAIFEISEKLSKDYGFVASPTYILKNLLSEVNPNLWLIEKFSIKINKIRRIDE